MDPQVVQQLALVLVGVGIAVFCSFSGLVIGVWLTKRSQSQQAVKEVRADHLLELMGQFSNWTQGFAGEVSEYGAQVRGLLQEMVNDPAIQASPAQSAVVQKLMQANEQLKQRLSQAEESLQDKTKEVENYLSQARTDQLTRLPNRRAFDDEFARLFAQWQRHSTPLALVIIDIDHFKSFNDDHGHLVGDAVLKGVARLLTIASRESDMLVRFGGEEFALILPNSGIDDAARAAKRLRQAIEGKPIHHEGNYYSVTISCGAAQAVGGDTIQNLIKRADESLYAAKEHGRNCGFYHDGIRPHPVTEDRAHLADEARGGIPARFNDVCDQLRNRLMEVTQE